MQLTDTMEPEWRNEGAFHLLRRVLQRHNALWRERLPAITPVQFSVLLSISNLPGADQKTVGSASAVEPTTMANLIARMAKADLLSRTVDPQDGRRQRLTLTAAGRRELEASLPVVRAVRDECLSAISAADRRRLRHILGAIADAGDDC